MINPDLKYYGLFLAARTSQQFEGSSHTIEPEIILTFKSTASGRESHDDQFINDMEVMNVVRTSADPAVITAYEQLITVMALTKGRVAPPTKVKDVKSRNNI